MSEPQNNINLGELKKTLSQSVIHYDPTRVDYTINDLELTQLEEIGKSIWKEIFFVSLGIAISTILNGIVAFQKLKANETWNKEMFLNFLFGGICFALTIISAIIWIANFKKKENIINKIKNKPQFLLPQ